MPGRRFWILAASLCLTVAAMSAEPAQTAVTGDEARPTIVGDVQSEEGGKVLVATDSYFKSNDTRIDAKKIRFDTRTGQLYRDALGRTIPMQTINPANYVMLEKMAKIADGRFYRALDQAQLGRVYEEIDRLERTEVRFRESVVFESHRLIWVGLAALLLLAEIGWAVLRPRAP